MSPIEKTQTQHLILEKEKSVLLFDSLYDHPVLRNYVRHTEINNPYQLLIEKGIIIYG